MDYNGSYTMMAKSMKTLELHYPMIQFLKIVFITCKFNCLFAECIRVKFSDKVLERSWSEIRTSMNQKCLDRLKHYRRNFP